MNVNRKLGRFKQWAGERMGGEAKTSVSDDFKSLEIEMGLRQEGMERLQKSMNGYVKVLSKRHEGEDKEKSFPIAHLGSTMVNHGEDFEDDSDFGQCLQAMGRANERVGRIQETYLAEATSSWLESLERSMIQMKEYQSARKRLESRRLAYDASLAKIAKAKKEDFKVEEELRTQKAKYEETSEDVYRRMQDIKEAEEDSVADLGSFLDAELKYYDRCRDVLMKLRHEWPAGQAQSDAPEERRDSQSRTKTAHAYADRFAIEEELPIRPERPSIKSQRTTSSQVMTEPSRRDRTGDYTTSGSRPALGRANTAFEGPTQLYRDSSPMGVQRVSRVPSDSVAVRAQRSQLRPVNHGVQEDSVFSDPSDESMSYSSPDRPYLERSASPATSIGSAPSRNASSSALEGNNIGKRTPPPPPPSRAKKPPPPPPPMKRSALSTTTVSYA